MAAAAPPVKLVSSDEKTFHVPSHVTKQMYDIVAKLQNNAQESIQLQNIKADALKKVIEWCEIHKDDPPAPGDDAVDPPPPEEDENSEEVMIPAIDPRDFNFIRDIDSVFIFDVILAATYLNVRGLLDTCCRVVANLIMGLTVEEIITKDQARANAEENSAALGEPMDAAVGEGGDR